jgi:hypothetical protein
MQSVRRHPVRILGAGLLLALVVGLAALVLGGTAMLRMGNAPGSPAGTAHHIHTTYPILYTNLHELKAASPLIVVGTVQSFSFYTHTLMYGKAGAPLWTVQVQQMVKNRQLGTTGLSVVAAGTTTLTVVQYGGPNDVNDSDPALHVGERLVLFLSTTSIEDSQVSYADGFAPDSSLPTAFMIVNGGVGQWIVGPGGTVVHRRPWPTSGQQEQAKAIPLAAFLAQVQAA